MGVDDRLLYLSKCRLDVLLPFVDDLITGWSVNQANAVYHSIALGLLQADIATSIGKSQQNVSKVLNSSKESLLKLSLKYFETIILKHKG